jgi:hypothetical protein
MRLTGMWIWPLLPSFSGDELRSKAKTAWGASSTDALPWWFGSPLWRTSFCGSIQRLGAMALVLVCGGQLSSRASSGDFGDSGIRRWMALREDANTLKDLYVISMFCRGLCIGWLLSLYPWICICMFPLQSNIDTRIIKKKTQFSVFFITISIQCVGLDWIHLQTKRDDRILPTFVHLHCSAVCTEVLPLVATSFSKIVELTRGASVSSSVSYGKARTCNGVQRSRRRSCS